MELEGGSWARKMGSVTLQPPHPFHFRNPDELSKRKRRFQLYHLASGLSGKNGARQVSTLLYCLGEEADVLTSANANEEDRKKLLSKMSTWIWGPSPSRRWVGTGFTSGAKLVRSYCGHQDHSWYIILWPKSSTPAKAERRMEACCICLQISDRDGNPNRSMPRSRKSAWPQHEHVNTSPTTS